MPIVWSRTNTVAIAEAEVQAAPLKHRKRVIPRASDIILRPALLIPVGRRVDQHEQAL